MKRTLIRLAMTAAVPALLAGCHGGDKKNVADVPPPTSTPPPPSVPTTASLESLGAGFASIYRADANSEPRDPSDGDIAPISFTTEALEITGT